MSMNEPISTEPPVYSQNKSLFDLGGALETKSIESRNTKDSGLAMPSLSIDLESSHSIGEETEEIEAAKICQIREENAKLVQLAQYLTNYNNSLKRLIEHEYRTPNAKRALLEKLVDEYGLSRRHVCRLLNLARSTCWYKSTSKKDKKSGSPISSFNEEAV